MPKFLTTLRVERVEDTSRDGRGTWQLLNPFAYKSEVAETVFVVPQGFITDFASVPRIPVAFLLTGDCAQEAAVIHDWLYTSHEVDRATADAVFREAVALGNPGWRAWLMWAGVRVGGGGSWEAAGPPQPESVLLELAP
jgi:uncharacterized caspase-like protein